MPTVPQYLKAIQRASAAGDKEAAASLQEDMQTLLTAESSRRAAEDMGPLERGLANVGAGMTNLWDSARQLTPGVKGPTDEEIRDKRVRDEALAKATETGIGPDWAPSFGTALQFAGEQGPLAVIPVGRVGQLAAKGLKALPKALQVSERARNVISASTSGATAGAIGGAAAPVTSDESRGANMAWGAAGGAALPGAIAAGRAGYNFVRDAFSPARRAGKVLTNALGEDASMTAAEARAREAQRLNEDPAVRKVPESLSEATGSPRAAMLERRVAADPNTAPMWVDRAREQNQARYRAVQQATDEEGLLKQRKSDRDKATGPMRRDALRDAAADPDFASPVYSAAESRIAGEGGTNPDVTKVMSYLQNVITDPKYPVTPERLYNARKVILQKLAGGQGIVSDDLGAAMRGARRETLEMKDVIDDALDHATGGKWRSYLQRYEAESGPVEASKAARRAQEVFNKDSTPLLGGDPHVTVTNLAQAIKAGQSTFDPSKSALSSKSQKILDDLLQQQKVAQEPQRAGKFAGTSGGGSATHMFQQQNPLVATGLKLLLSPVPVVGHVVNNFISSHAVPLSTQIELSKLLQNPKAAAAAIERALTRGMPLTKGQEALLAASARAAGQLAGGAAGSPSRD
jgi:hypothetical protein